MKLLTLIALIYGNLFVAGRCLSIPVELSPVTLEGKLEACLWVNQIEFYSDAEDGFMAAYKQPACYYLRVKTTSLSKSKRDELNIALLWRVPLKHPFFDAKRADDHLIIKITSPLRKDMTKGASIKVVDYAMFGNGAVINSKFSSIMISGKLINLRKTK
jgi:hypothetical protein